MNILLWVLQVMLALHTIMGAIWKFSNSAQSLPSLASIPQAVWYLLIVIELVCSLTLLVPLVKKSLGNLVPFAALFIVLEMLMYSVIDIFSSSPEFSQITYWLVVAVISGFIAYGRFSLKPIQVKQE